MEFAWNTQKDIQKAEQLFLGSGPVPYLEYAEK